MKTVLERFEAKFIKSDGCWEWTASKFTQGYGQFRIDGKTRYAHRIAYQLYIGEILEGMCVCHKCDNTSCVNPTHLFLGTIADNMRDRNNKGRVQAGEKHYRAKLTKEQVIEIRTRYDKGASGIDLAKEFDVTHQAISKIIRGLAWKNISCITKFEGENI